MAFGGGFRLDPLALKGVPDDQLYEEWKEWKRSLDHILEATAVEDKNKFNCLMAYGGKELQKIYYSLDPEPKISYKEAVNVLESYFRPKHHAVFARHKFWELRREPDESIDELVMKIRSKAELCSFGKSETESMEVAMMDKLLMLMPRDIKEKLLQHDNIKFTEAIKVIKAHDAAKFQARQLVSSSNVSPSFMEVNQIGRRQDIVCFRCGNKSHKADYERCPARKADCRKCGREGHFAVMCKQSGDYKRKRTEIRNIEESNPKRMRREVRNVEDDSSSETEEEEDC